MISKFMDMEEEKRNRIIYAAMKEFALRGYKDAKTDNIVQEAGISKGLLFHYFGTKKKLYLFLYEYAMDICENYLEEINTDPDIFERARQNGLAKIKLIQQNPDLFNFLISTDLKGMDEKNEEMEARKAAFFKKAYDKAFSGFDHAKFRDDIDPKQAIDIIIWTMEGYTTRIMKNYGDSQVQDLNYDSYMAEVDSYFSLLKKSLYK